MDLLTCREVCAFFGRSRPLDPSTLYRGVAVGRFPRPIRVGGSSRWLRSECDAALRAMVEDRS